MGREKVPQTVPGTSVQEEEGLRCAGWKSSCREAAGKGWWAREGPAEGAVHRAAALEGPYWSAASRVKGRQGPPPRFAGT